ncbi:MAG TPA: hypothetical protein VHS06_04085, partial [Chloroflexota bacterium]|nr:hypothetical protein [Chloroflexota bacterium]
MKRSVLVVVLTLLLVLAFCTQALAASAPYTGVALYCGSATLTDSSKVTSPLVGGQPSAATYVNGVLKTSKSASLSGTTLVVNSATTPVPLLGQFMPADLVASLTQA